MPQSAQRCPSAMPRTPDVLLNDLAARLAALKPQLAAERLTPQLQHRQTAIARHGAAANEYLRGARRGMRLPQMEVKMQLERALACCNELEAALQRPDNN
ncbi:hypothetical protein KH5H1_56510 [Corallococcus caeni]|nr:hypothetical protein KH5H1_56510 [Corallococcus sp. KH5-1]